MKTKIAIVAVIASLALNAVFVSQHLNRPVGVTAAHADEVNGEELAQYMGRLQRFSHKAALAVDAGNQQLAAFYATEINETLGQVTRIFVDYDGFKIGALTTAMLKPQATAFATAVDGGDMAAASAAYDNLTNACNMCHTATQRPFIKIKRVKTNPYNQDFSK